MVKKNKIPTITFKSIYLKLVNVMTKSPSKDTAHKTYMKMVNNFSISSSHFRFFWPKDFPTIQPKLFLVNCFIHWEIRSGEEFKKGHTLSGDWRRIRG